MAHVKDSKKSKKALLETNRESALASKLSKKQPSMLKFLKLQQHQDDLLKWMTGSADDATLQFVR